MMSAAIEVFLHRHSWLLFRYILQVQSPTPSTQVQQPDDDENPLGCALDADGNLKDAADIKFYQDPDDIIPLPQKTATTTVVPQGVSSSSKGSKRPRPLDTSEY